MNGWSEVLRRGQNSLLIGFSLGMDMSCSGRLRYMTAEQKVELLRLPDDTEDSPELQNFIGVLEKSLKSDRIPWQKTCTSYISLKAEEGYERMMRQVCA